MQDFNEELDVSYDSETESEAEIVGGDAESNVDLVGKGGSLASLKASFETFKLPFDNTVLHPFHSYIYNEQN